MAVQEGPDEFNEKALRTEWPVDEGLTAGTTRQEGDKFLHPEGIHDTRSTVKSKDNVGLSRVRV